MRFQHFPDLCIAQLLHPAIILTRRTTICWTPAPVMRIVFQAPEPPERVGRFPTQGVS